MLLAVIDMQVVILAGGLATRLGGLTGDYPNSPLIIQGKPFLEYQLELLRRADIGNVVLCLVHLGELLHTHWEVKKERSPSISDPFLDECYELA